MKQENKSKKKIPEFWWDFEWKNGIIVAIAIECDNKEYGVIKRISLDSSKEFYDDEIREAEKYISDLEAGRIVIK